MPHPAPILSPPTREWPRKPLSFVGMLFASPRVGQNAVLGSLRKVIPGAGEFGSATAPDGRLVFTMNRPVPSESLWTGWDITEARFGAPVWLSRRDRVAQAVSWVMAAQTGQFRSDQIRVRSPEYSQQLVDSYLERIVEVEALIESQISSVTHLRLWYEDDVERDPRRAAQRILGWWGIKGKPGRADIRRTDASEKRAWSVRFGPSTLTA
jgi:hypothetical protein